MAKFSVGIEEDGEGPSNRVAKRQRVVRVSDLVCPVQEDAEQEDEREEEEEEEEEGEEEEEEEEEEDEYYDEEEEESGAEQGAMSLETNRDGSISITLTDPEVLDCSICYEALTIPVFQCENGHIACSICCIKIRNKCPSCATPIGYSRCRAIEKVLESVKVSCQNTKYGCREAFRYSIKQKHEKICPYAPCSCPLADCNFEGSSKELYEHFRDKHKYSATRFQYDRTISITVGIDERFCILQEEQDGSLFILNNKVETLGNVVTLSRIGPSEERGFFYDLMAKALTEASTVRLQSFTKSTPKQVDNPPSLGFLLVPSQFSCNSRKLKMDLRLWHHAWRSPTRWLCGYVTPSKPKQVMACERFM
ncbi:RING/U-box and TRAF-like domains, putative isoform 1 [Theobroma cacao]|uniref:RING-type E3 ubiquitin transferase n=1 Tax=Theobroma cacao TaxID=3641 RepID=A0A061EG86_THECC|nr:RING/U-box and TRAF-like domains, putative isoform 1 [Theobroma cacao]